MFYEVQEHLLHIFVFTYKYYYQNNVTQTEINERIKQ